MSTLNTLLILHLAEDKYKINGYLIKMFLNRNDILFGLMIS